MMSGAQAVVDPRDRLSRAFEDVEPLPHARWLAPIARSGNLPVGLISSICIRLCAILKSQAFNIDVSNGLSQYRPRLSIDLEEPFVFGIGQPLTSIVSTTSNCEARLARL